MSDVSHGADSPQGPDWWQASDDRWYPGELHPWRRPGEAAGAPESRPGTSYGYSGGDAVHITSTGQGRTGWHRPRRTALAGFVTLLLVAVVSVVVVGERTGGGRPSASRGLAQATSPAREHAGATQPTGPAHRSAPAPTTSGPGPGPTVAPPAPNPTGSSAGPDPSHALTTAAVTHVFKQIWPLFAEYASEDYLPGLLSIATQDVAHVVQAQDVCGCDEFWSPYTSVEFTAPVQDSYPLSFFAEVDQKDNPGGAEIQMLVFERQTPGEPWLITYAMGYAGTVPLLTAPADLGSVTTSPSPGPFNELAGLFDSLRQTGSPPAGGWWNSVINEPGKELTNFASNLAEGYDLDEALGIAPEANYGLDDLSVAFPVPGGSIACAVINAEVTMAHADGSSIVQTNANSAFGPLVPPGTYSTITFHEAVDTCVVLVNGIYGMQGLSGGTYSATWTK